MGFFSKLTKKATTVTNINVMQAIVASCILVAAADGDIEKKEVDKMSKLLQHNDLLSGFNKSDIQKTIANYTGIIEADFRVGKLKLMKEIRDIADNSVQAEEIFVTALAIAESDGEIEDKELNVLKEIATTLSISLKDYGLDSTNI